MNGIELIAQERARQLEVKGWAPEFDAQWIKEELAKAAICYALPPADDDKLGSEAQRDELIKVIWPWDVKWWKPTDRVKDLAKAGALIAAEIDRIQRLTEPKVEH